MNKEEQRITIKQRSGTPILFDGHVSKYEYVDAEYCIIKGPYGEIDIFMKIVDSYGSDENIPETWGTMVIEVG